MTGSGGRSTDLAWKGAAALCVAAFMIIVASGYAFRGKMPDTTEPGWPPRLGERYPDLSLRDSSGASVVLSSFAGKTLLIELVGMRSSASQAFAGGKEHGGLGEVSPQVTLSSLESHFAELAGGVAYDDPRLQHVKIIIYNQDMAAPSPEEISRWARHFGLDSKPNVSVLGGGPSLIGGASYTRIPGFHLVDRDFVLRMDAAGYKPPHSLFEDLLPKIGSFLE